MKRWILTLAISIAAISVGAAETPAVIEYEGRVTVSGKPFNGEGQFKFALLDTAGEPLWTSNEPIQLAVADGTYKVRLGDPALDMNPLPAEIAANWQNLRIRTSFNDGEHGWAEAGVTALAKSGGSASSTAPTATSEEATLQAILREMRRLRSEVATLRQEVRATKTASPARPSTPAKAESKPKKPVRVSLAEAERHSLGSADAPLVLVEFTDFECGYCKRFFDQTLPQLQKKYIDTGKLRFVSRNYPITSHPQAGPAAQALLSAASQDSDVYWPMRAWLFENNRELGKDAYVKYVTEAGLDVPRFLSDVSARIGVPKLDEDVAAAKSVGITGTPSFVLGTSDGKMIHGERIVGAKSFQVFSDKIESLLSAQAK